MARRIADLDERDYQTRIALRAQLRALRVDQGVSQRELGDRLGGRDGSCVRRLERQGVDQSRTSTVMRWARALGKTLALEPVGFPRPATFIRPSKSSDVDALLSAILPGLTGDEWDIARMIEKLAGIRIACSVSQEKLADRLNLTEQAVSFFETSAADTALVMLQRHARGIAKCSRRPDAHLAVRLEDPAPQPETDQEVPDVARA